MSTHTPERTQTSQGQQLQERHPIQWLALTFGVVYTLVGLSGFFLTGFDGFASSEGSLLLIFEVNPLHNIAHLLTGVLGLALWTTYARAKAYGWFLAVTFTGLVLYAIAIATTEVPDVLALNAADNWFLHPLTAVLGFVMALWPRR